MLLADSGIRALTNGLAGIIACRGKVEAATARFFQRLPAVSNQQLIKHIGIYSISGTEIRYRIVVPSRIGKKMRPKQQLRSSALWLYRLATTRRRSRMLHDLRAGGNLPIAILFYHRIADTHSNEWSMSHRDFAMQLDWLQTNFDVVSLEEAQRRIRSTHNDRPTVAITFDDGYAENSQTAIPELVRRNLPATYFIATDFMRTGDPFPHDRQRGVALQPNSIDDLRQYAALGIELGAHTKSHANCGAITDIASLRNEIIGSAHELEQWCQVPIRYFSFPYGMPENTSQLAVDVVRDAGFAGFCTAYTAWNWPCSNGFHLRRIHADPGLQSLKNRLTLDPRKLHDDQPLPFIEAPQTPEPSGSYSPTE